ncbi:hypothetical protein RJT34_02803 [Clitoria ternatea]|uniref:RING-type E3 ubiquitin transferase n=1 Tax=Clitoria ternatea TaxID=43366 RepID=A0AAN9KI89_CLITE
MANLFLSFLSLLFFFLCTTAEFTCESTSCNNAGISIQFPFWLRLSNQSYRCGFPGFELSCTQNTSISQPILSLPESGNFLVKLISFEAQRVWINDPEGCLPKRIMRDHGFNLQGSPFRLSNYFTYVDFNFLNCPSNFTSSGLVQPVTCLDSEFNANNNSYSVVAVVANPSFPTPWTNSCDFISRASIPVSVPNTPWLFWMDYYTDIQLQWDTPSCGNCVARGGRCALTGDPNFNVACYDPPSHAQGLSRKTKYGLSIGLGVPGLLCFTGLACIFCCKRNPNAQIHQRETRSEISSLVLPRPPVIVMGLDGPALERYPTTQLGESGRLPKPNDNVCSICLCEYQPKEMLRTIPECNHYFHANCVDSWLKMNATCPLCRNLPHTSYPFSTSLPFSSTSS